VRLLGRHLTPENHQVVLARAKGRSRQQIEALVAELAPQPDVPSSVRKIPILTVMPFASAPRAPATPNLYSEPTAAIAPSPAAFVPTPRPIVRATAPERYRVQFTVGVETHEKLRRVQALLRREIPDGDPGAIFDRALTLLLDKVAKTKLAAAVSPRPYIRLSVPRRMTQPARATSRGRSSARPGGATAASAPSFLRPDGGVRSGPSWNSIMFSPMRNGGRPPSRTFPFAVGATINTRRS
jgi:hypothetical protein